MENKEAKTNYIGISEHRLHHILEVARKCYQLAKEEGFDEDFCRKMWVIGWNHDIGYEFSQKQMGHAALGADMLSLVGVSEETEHAVRKHGHYTDNKTAEWRILNTADMLIDSRGNEVDVMERLHGIRVRYGENSEQYLTACDICYQIGLTAVNIASNIY